MSEQKIFYSKYQFPRKELTQSLLKQICSDGFVAYGLFKKRRSGKTHFLYEELKPEAEKLGINVFYFSFMNRNKQQETNIIQDFYQSLLQFLKRNFKPSEKIKNVFSFFSSIGLSVDLINGNINENNKNNGLNIDLKTEKLSELIQNIQYKERSLVNLFEKLKDNDQKILLLLDEFQDIHFSKDCASFCADLRTMLDMNKKNVKTIFTSPSKNKLYSFFYDYNQPFYNFGNFIELKDFNDDFLKYVASNFFKNTNRYLNWQELKYIFEDSGKSPYYVVQSVINMEINPDLTLEKSYQRLLKNDQKLLLDQQIKKNFWNNLPLIEKFVIQKIANLENNFYSEKVYLEALENEIINPNINLKQFKARINYAIKKLKQKEIISNEIGLKNHLTSSKNIYQINDKAFEEWLLDNEE